MRELCFVCPDCSKHLSIPIEGAGLTCACSECDAKIRVPDPAIEFACTVCGDALCAEGSLRGTTFQCPKCRSQTSIPVTPVSGEERLLGLPVKISCPSCGVHLDYDDDFRREMAGRTVDCPKCDSPIAIKGTPTEQSLSPVSPPAPNIHSQPTQIFARQECKHCGESLAPNSVTCQHCGAAV